MAQPKSWADDLNTYRSTRGNQAYSIIRSAQDVPRRLVRTALMPFADPNHPYYSYQEPQYHANEQDGSLERYRRHGARCDVGAGPFTIFLCTSYCALFCRRTLLHRVVNGCAMCIRQLVTGA